MGADHDLLIRLEERVTDLQARVEDLEEKAERYVTQRQFNPVSRVLWLIGTAILVGLTGGALAAIGRALQWAASAH